MKVDPARAANGQLRSLGRVVSRRGGGQGHKTEERDGMGPRTKNIFISHRREDEARIHDMKALLRAAGQNVRDSSVYSGKGNRAKNEAYIKHLLGRRIRWAGTLVVIVSKITRLSKWVNWEIAHAMRTGTRIVGVWADGQAKCAVPSELRKYADAMVPWDGAQIRDAIDGNIDGWHEPDGLPVPICDFPPIRC